MRNKIGTACMILGTVMVLAALALFLWNRRENQEAAASVEMILPKVISQIPAPEEKEEALTEPTYPNPYEETVDAAMTETEIDGYSYIGYLSIPAIELELPIMAQWDYPRLKIAPCRYVGSTKTDDLVICAHNYDRHFGPIRRLSPGDEVYFTDMDGTVRRYEVAAVETLEPDDIDGMTSGEYALTLFTCTYGGATRVTVRCNTMDS